MGFLNRSTIIFPSDILQDVSKNASEVDVSQSLFYFPILIMLKHVKLFPFSRLSVSSLGPGNTNLTAFLNVYFIIRRRGDCTYHVMCVLSYFFRGVKRKE